MTRVSERGLMAIVDAAPDLRELVAEPPPVMVILRAGCLLTPAFHTAGKCLPAQTEQIELIGYPPAGSEYWAEELGSHSSTSKHEQSPSLGIHGHSS